MSSNTFQFSSAARLYCQNVAVVDEIKNSTAPQAGKLFKEHMALIAEMRAEAYQTIATFGEVLLEQLSYQNWEKEGVRLCEQTTYTTKSWVGQRICSRWLESLTKDALAGHGFIYVFLPIPDKIKKLEDDTNLRSHFEMLTEHRLTVVVRSDAPDLSQRRRITNLARNEAFGTFHWVNAKASTSKVYVPIDATDPIGPTAERIAALLRAIYEIDYPRS